MYKYNHSSRDYSKSLSRTPVVEASPFPGPSLPPHGQPSLKSCGGTVSPMEGMEVKVSKFRTICVFCGSSSGKKRSYSEAAEALGKELVERRIDLVYGGGSIGLMGDVAKVVSDGGCHVLGVIPKTLMAKELTGATVGEVRVVSDMHERKAEMARQADAFIALPGGYGTLEELLEVITWAQLGIHSKPVGLLNVDGYYNILLSFIDKAVDEGFISFSARDIIVSAPTAKALIEELEEYVPQQDEVVSKLIWEAEPRSYYTPEPEASVASAS